MRTSLRFRVCPLQPGRELAIHVAGLPNAYTMSEERVECGRGLEAFRRRRIIQDQADVHVTGGAPQTAIVPLLK